MLLRIYSLVTHPRDDDVADLWEGSFVNRERMQLKHELMNEKIKELWSNMDLFMKQ